MKNKFILLNKPSGMTSFDVIRILKKELDTNELGHTGTLDPMAKGLLIIAYGKEALKAVRFVNAEDKEYIATLKLGIKTNTGDITGEVIEKSTIPNLDNVEEILKTFLGKQEQIPPMYSAKKINGKKLYEYARAGEHVDIPAEYIEIKEIEFISKELEEVTFRVLVSKGTYVRVICEEISTRLGAVGTMSDLTRTSIGEFNLNQACEIDNLKQSSFKSILDTITLQQVKITNEEAAMVALGQTFILNEKGTLALVNNGKLVSVVESKEQIKIVRNFHENN